MCKLVKGLWIGKVFSGSKRAMPTSYYHFDQFRDALAMQYHQSLARSATCDGCCSYEHALDYKKGQTCWLTLKEWFVTKNI